MRTDETRCGPQNEQLSTARVQTAAFLQQVQETIELEPPWLWNCRYLLVS
jgi:hypothetical protein